MKVLEVFDGITPSSIFSLGGAMIRGALQLFPLYPLPQQQCDLLWSWRLCCMCCDVDITGNDHINYSRFQTRSSDQED